MFDDAFDINNGNGVNAGKRLIQQNEFRISGQRAGDFNAAAFTATYQTTTGIILRPPFLPQGCAPPRPARAAGRASGRQAGGSAPMGTIMRA